MKIIDRYIIKEFLPPFFIGLMLFTFVLLTNKIYKLTELIVNKGVSVFDIFKLISFILPSFLTLTIPMAVLLGTLVAFGRLSTDCEITAMKAAGMSFRRLLRPVIWISVVMMAVTAYFSLYLGPMKARTFKRDLFVMAKSSALVDVEEEVFNDSFKNLILYAQKIPSPNEMEGVFISDERNPKQPYVVIAKKGLLDVDMNTGYANLYLTQGSIHKKGNKPGSYQEIMFDSNTISINLYDKIFGEDGGKDKHGKTEMTLDELRATAHEMDAAGKKNGLMTEYYKRFTLPLACIIFGLIGPPLGLYSRRSGKSSGISIALAIFALYYIIMKAGEGMASNHHLHPLAAELLPNIIIGALGLLLVSGSDRDNVLQQFEVYTDWARAQFDSIINRRRGGD